MTVDVNLFETLLREAPIGISIIDSSGRIAWVNEAYLRMTGTTPRILGRIAREIPEIRKTFFHPGLESALRDGSSVSLKAIPILASPPGTVRFVDLDIRPLRQGESESSQVVLISIDVTDRVRAHERARLFHEAFLTSTNAIEVTDRDGILVDVNPAFEKIYGYSREECIGRKPNLVRGRNTPREIYAQMWVDLLDPSRGHWSGEMMNRDREGNERPVFLTITAIRSQGGETTHYIGVAVDLAERKAWERGAAHADKLASLGQLAAGVAHEINTPLANVMLVAESIRRRATDPWVSSRAGAIVGQIKVADRIVLGLLDFARRGELQVTSLDLSKVARDSVAFIRGKQSQDVELIEIYPKAPLTISGDRSQLIQVLTNILNNAYDAMNGHGRIRIETRQDGGSVDVEITDTGPGIPPEVLSHLFEPFFTTKPEGKGTGLGLAICHGIVQSHHGTIAVRNTQEGGAQFTIAFPVRKPQDPS